MGKVERHLLVNVNRVCLLEIVVGAYLLGNDVAGAESFEFDIAAPEAPEVLLPHRHDVAARLDGCVLESFADAAVGEGVEVPGVEEFVEDGRVVVVIAVVVLEVPHRADVGERGDDLANGTLEPVGRDAGEGGGAALVGGTGDHVDGGIHVLVAALGLEEGFALGATVGKSGK